MKKSRQILLISLMLIVLFSMTACGSAKVFTKDNMESTSGLTLAKGSNFAYYTDIEPDTSDSNTITVSTGAAAGTNINIISDSSTSGKKLGYFTDKVVEKSIKDELDKFNSTSPNMKMTMSDFSLKDDTIRGVKVKRSSYTITVSAPSSGVNVSMNGEQVVAPLESGMVIITLTSVNDSTELDQTFENICNTIYGK